MPFILSYVSLPTDRYLPFLMSSRLRSSDLQARKNVPRQKRTLACPVATAYHRKTVNANHDRD